MACVLAFMCLMSRMALAVATGTIAGTAKDASSAVIPGVSVTLTCVETGLVQTAQTDAAGFYRFAALPLGTYNITFTKDGFKRYARVGMVINVDTALGVDATLEVGANQEQVTVTSTAAQVDTETTQMGEVIGGHEMTNLPLNGRAYTDLLALQPGVVPFSTSLFGSESPANSLSNGLLSMAGAQDTHSGFMVNGANAVEGYSGGTFLIPTLDSIAEFRIITGNAGAEYGNYSGGLVNVVTKSGTNSFHGDVFEFLRNSDFDAKNYFSDSRGVLHQNQFGATGGGPIWRNKAFFFGDWQSTRLVEGVNTGRIYVPSNADKTGNLSDMASDMDGTVNGAYFASVLSSRLGYTVTSGEPYYTAGCTSSSQCVFPNAVIPSAAWSPVSPSVIKLLPDQTVLASGTQAGYFSTSKYSQTLNDDKGGARIDFDTRYGSIMGYYHLDPWNNVLPYDGYGSSSVPGFPGISSGKAELYVVSLTTRFGSTAVNVLNGSWTRNRNDSGQTAEGLGTDPSSLGFASASDLGIYTVVPKYSNYPLFGFNDYTLGPQQSIITQHNNMFELQDDFTKVVGSHTLKTGAQLHWDKVDIAHPNNASNGAFQFNGSETGSDFADMLIGAPSVYYQGDPAVLNLRNYYLGAYIQDSWKVKSGLTLNYGIRWDVDPYWEDSHNRSPIILKGVQSTTFPGAPAGYLFPGDAGTSRRSGADTRFNNFGPRIGIAYTPSFQEGLLHTIFGNPGTSSIRTGFGLYYTNVQGANTFNFAAAPYADFYWNTIPVLLEKPFLNRQTGESLGQHFPTPALDPNNINWALYEPFSSNSNPLPHSPTPYEEHLEFSIERSLGSNSVLTVAYVGTFGHHLVVAGDNNPGDPSLCMSVSQDSQTTDGVTCGPYGEGGTYHPASGGTIQGTRTEFGHLFGNNAWYMDIGNSSYHAFETTLRSTGTRLSTLLSYTYSKAIDNGSGFGDQVFVYGDHNHFRGLSNYDLPHNFAANFTAEIPWDLLFKKQNSLTRGWKISGLAQFTSGVPIQISEPDDRSLTGNSGLAFAGTTDEPNLDRTSGSLYGTRDPRANKPYLNTSLFSQEPLGGQGNSPRRMLHGPGMDNWNLAMLKDVKLRKEIGLEIRAEFFNVFNHAQFQGLSVNGNFNSSGFGMVTSASDPRIGQMAAKLTF